MLFQQCLTTHDLVYQLPELLLGYRIGAPFQGDFS